MTDKKDMNQDRAKVFCEKGVKVHISKKSGVFYNGLILEVDETFFFIDDIKDGKQLIFFEELNKPITVFTDGGG